MKEINIKKQYPFQYYTIRNVDLLEQNGFNFDDYSFNKKHSHELYIGNINGLCCRHSFVGEPDKMMEYLDSTDGIKRKFTFLLPENYRDCINGLLGFRRSVLRVLDAESLQDQITVITYKVDNSDIIDKIEDLSKSMKFDACIMNPPYGSLQLKVLNRVVTYKICDNIIAIGPYQWIVEPYKNTNLQKKLEDEVHLFNQYDYSVVSYVDTDLSTIFDIGEERPGGILVLANDNESNINLLTYHKIEHNDESNVFEHFRSLESLKQHICVYNNQKFLYLYEQLHITSVGGNIG